MISFHSRRLLRKPKELAVVAGMLLAVPLMADAAEPDLTALPPSAATCDTLRGWMQHYDIEKGSQHMGGRRLIADVAVARCAAGDYQQGVRILVGLMRDAGYSPPAK